MGLFSRRIFLLVLLLLVPRWPAAAADIDFPSPDQAVSAKGMTSYLDLARHFVPDIQAVDGAYVGNSLIKLRHIAGDQYAGADATSFGFYDISAVRMQSAGKERLLVLFDFAQSEKAAQGVAVLGLYDISGEPKLLDAADIGFDQSTYFFDQALLPIADDSDAILTMSTHFNSNQTYVMQALIMVRDDRLEFVDKISLFDDRACGRQRHQTIAYDANPAAGKPYAPIIATVTDTTTVSMEECGDGAQASNSSRQIRTTYRWQTASARYVPDSDAFSKLAKENEQRF